MKLYTQRATQRAPALRIPLILAKDKVIPADPNMAHRPAALRTEGVQHGRPLSAPPESEKAKPTKSRSSSIPPGKAIQRSHRVMSDTQVPTASKDMMDDVSLDLTGLLQRSGPTIVKTRTGSVLSRGFILKTDHYPSGS